MGLKTELIACMRGQFPEGVGLHQLRDIIQTFAMGWASALKATNHAMPYLEAELVMRICADETWMPDSTWRWWEVQLFQIETTMDIKKNDPFVKRLRRGGHI